jgi:uncharacterized protein (TIGR02246 family)
MERLGRRLLLALVLVLVSQPAAAQAEDVRAAIEAGNARFIAAFSRGDATAIAALYTSGAVVFPPQADMVRGRDAIERFWKGAMDAGIKGVTLLTVEVEAHGDTAHEVGTYGLVGEGGRALDTGKYVVIWMREQGQWKLHRDIWNTSLPPAK